jgi:ribonuclease BN (tRNA processing enzyme)
MVLTHFYPDALKSDIENVAHKYFDGEIVLAKDGMQLDLSLS